VPQAADRREHLRRAPAAAASRASTTRRSRRRHPTAGRSRSGARPAPRTCPSRGASRSAAAAPRSAPPAPVVPVHREPALVREGFRVASERCELDAASSQSAAARLQLGERDRAAQPLQDARDPESSANAPGSPARPLHATSPRGAAGRAPSRSPRGPSATCARELCVPGDQVLVPRADRRRRRRVAFAAWSATASALAASGPPVGPWHEPSWRCVSRSHL